MATELKTIVDGMEAQSAAFSEFVKNSNETLADVRKGVEGVREGLADVGDRIEALEAKDSTPGRTGSGPKPAPSYKTLITSGGQKAYAVPSSAKLSDVPALKSEAPVSLDRWANALVFGNACGDKEAVEYMAEQKSVSTGSTGALIPAEYVAQWIDMAREQSVLSAAGMQTVTMPAKTMTWSHQTADPTLAWRATEGAALSATDPTFAARTLTAKTIAVRTQVSLEASMDIPNFGQQIVGAYSRAFAAAIDGAGISGLTPAPTGIQGTSGVGAVTSVGTPTNWDEIVDGAAVFLSANNQLSELSGIVWHPDVWKVYAKLKTGISSDNTPLELPPAIANVPRFVTVNADDSAASPPSYHVVMGNFNDLIMGVRMDPTIRVLDSTTSMAANLLVEVVGVARIDFLVTRPASFVVLEDVTIA